MNVREYTLSQRYATAFLHAYYALLTEPDKKSLMESITFLKNKKHVAQLLNCTPFNKQIPSLIINTLPFTEVMKNCFLKLSELLVRNRRMNIFLYILHTLLVAWDKKDKVFRFTITSSCPLLEEQKEIIVRFLKKETKGTIVCAYVHDTSLIGGITMTSDTYTWSNSIKDRLKIIEHSIVQKGTYEY